MVAKGLAACLFVLLSAHVAAAPAIITVGQGAGYHYHTIQEAINAATAGDTIIVYPGTYVENIHLLGKNVELKSSDPMGSTVVVSTIIDGNSSGPVVRFAGTESNECALLGFTIRNGDASGAVPFDSGGGIQGQGTSARIEYNAITMNSAANYGGAICACNGTIRYNEIRGNWAWRGGALARCNGVIQGNVIVDNEARLTGGYPGLGGALYDCDGSIQNNIIIENQASNGGGLYLCYGTICNNVIAGNRAMGAFPVGCGGGVAASGGTIQNNTIVGNQAAYYGGGFYHAIGTIVNCIVWGNSAIAGATFYESDAPTYSCIENWTQGGVGNIAANPSFLDPDGPDNQLTTFEDNDYHLAVGSPCIDAGNPASLYNDALRPPGMGAVRSDMGAYGGSYNMGWTPSAAPGRPTNVSPADGATSLSLTPVLTSSAFSDTDIPDTHTASQWQVSRSSDFSSASLVVWDSGRTTSSLTSVVVRAGVLQFGSTYFWRVRHQDFFGNWGFWSNPTSFRCRLSRAPNRPSNVSPPNGATEVGLNPILVASSFSDPDVVDTHAASQWQISTANDFSGSPPIVWDSGRTTANLTSATVAGTLLTGGSTYFWRVRYQDNLSTWSLWSDPTSFQTVFPNNPPNQPTNVSPADAATGVGLTPTLVSSAFSDPDAADTHLASQWQVSRTSNFSGTPPLTWDSGRTTTNLTSAAVPGGLLQYGYTYYWRVRHQDNDGDWSSWSSPTSFQTPVYPDLTGTLLSVTPDPIIVGRPIGLAGSVLNQGSGVTTVAVNVEFWVINQQSSWTGLLCDSVPVGPLGVGQSFDLASSAPQRLANSNIPSGLYAVEMRIDPANAVAESNESNNVSPRLQCSILPDLPNLAVQGLDFWPQDVSPAGGQTITFAGRLRNTGSQPTSAGFWVEFRVSLDPNLQPQGPMLCDSLMVSQTLAVGEGVDLSTVSRTAYPLAEGAYYVGLSIDVSGAVAEQREGDNIIWVAAKQLYVGPRPSQAANWMLYR